MDAGVVSNTANATGTDPEGDPVTSPDATADTPVEQAPALQLTKSAAVTDVDADGSTDLGDTIGWSFAVTNTGTTTVQTLAIADPTAGAVACPVTTLAPGVSTTCTSGAHTIRQADVDAGEVSNTATATGRTLGGTPVTSNQSSTDTAVVRTAALAAQKHATVNDLDHDGRTDKGDTITWSVTVTNTGTATLHTVAIDDPTVAR